MGVVVVVVVVVVAVRLERRSETTVAQPVTPNMSTVSKTASKRHGDDRPLQPPANLCTEAYVPHPLEELGFRVHGPPGKEMR